MRAGCWRRGARPEELGTVYPHRWAVPREVWVRLFGSAEREIAILAYSALFLAEDAGVLRILADKGRAGVTVRIALGDPDGPNVAERGEEEGIGDAMPAKIRNALMLYRPLGTVENIEIRLHRTVLYNSIYRADDQFLVNQHTYGIPAAQAPVFCLSDTGSGEMAAPVPRELRARVGQFGADRIASSAKHDRVHEYTEALRYRPHHDAHHRLRLET